MKLHFHDTSDIVVREGLDRFRKDMGELVKLAESIKKYGQLQPIVITEKMELVAGGRRLAACILLRSGVECVYQKDLSDIELRLIEVEENIQRKALTPGEECLAIEELHLLKQKEVGKPQSPHDTGDEFHSLDDTANMLGTTRANIIKKIDAAQVIKQFPGLKTAKTLKEITTLGKIATKVIARNRAVEKLKSETLFNDVQELLVHENALIHMGKVKDKSIKILLTDPPWGIDIDKIAISVGGRTGEGQKQGFKYEDSKDIALQYYIALANDSYRFTTDDSHAYVFVAPEHFNTISMFFRKAGWQVHIRPLVWIKGSSGQNNAPHCWPSSCYEMILYARKRNSKLLLEGKPDWFQFNAISGEKKIHPAEKPIELYRELIKRSCLPGDTLYDPFAGSGNVLAAGLIEKLRVLGCEYLEDAYSAAFLRVKRYIK